SPDTGTNTKTYDANGNVLTSKDARGYKTTYTYDALNRKTKELYADGTSSTYQYDQGLYGIGHLTKMIDTAGITVNSYDQHGRLVEKTQKPGNVILTTRYAYDGGGRFVSMTYPPGKVVNVSYDADGQIAGLAHGNQWLISNVTYRPYGPAMSWKQGNSATF